MKKLILILFLCIISLSSIYAFSSSGRIFNLNCTSNLNDSWNNHDFLNNGITFNSGGCIFDGSADYATKSTNKTLITGNVNHTIHLKLNAHVNTGLPRYALDERGSTNGLQIRLEDVAGMKFSIVYDGTTAAAYKSTTTLSTNTNYSITVTYNGDTDKGIIYINGVNETHFTNTLIVTDDTGGVNLGMLRENLGSIISYFDGEIYEFCSFNRVFVGTDLSELNTYGCEGNVLIPKLYIFHNLTNILNFTGDDFYFHFNVSEENNAANSVNCSFIVDGAKVRNLSYVSVDTYPDTNNLTIIHYNTSNQEINHTISVFCKNSKEGGILTDVNVTTGNYILFVDNINVMIKSSFVNNSNFVQLTNIPIYVNFTDTNLYAYNISIFDSSNNLQENYFAANVVGTFAENKTNRIATIIDTFKIIFQAWDSHTGKIIKEYKVDKLENGLEFEDSIRIISDEITDSSFRKSNDRYVFSFTLDNTKNFHKFKIKSNNKLKYLEESNYMLHFVDINNNKWIDFNNNNYTEYTVEKESEYEYEIIFRNNKNVKHVTFNSIGDLNYEERIYYYTVTSTSSSINLTELERLTTEISEGIKMTWLIYLLIFTIILFLSVEIYNIKSIPYILTVIILGIILQYKFIIEDDYFLSLIAMTIWIVSILDIIKANTE